MNIQRLYDANAIDALLGCRTFSYWIYLIDNLSAQDYAIEVLMFVEQGLLHYSKYPTFNLVGCILSLKHENTLALA